MKLAHLYMQISKNMKLFLVKSFVIFILILSLIGIVNTIFPHEEDGYYREYFDKIDKLKNEDREPSLILLGGSNVAFGFNTQTLEDSLNVPVINMGLHAGIGLNFIVDDCLRYLKPHDMLVLFPEYTHFYDNYAYGERVLSSLFLLRPFYVSKVLNYREFFQIIKCLPLSLNENISIWVHNHIHPEASPTEIFVYKKSAFNSYGDVIAHWVPWAKELPQDFVDENHLPTNKNMKLNKAYIEHLEIQLEKLREKEISVIIIPPVLAKSQYVYNKKSIEHIYKYLQAKFDVISCCPEDMAYDNSLFFGTVYHLNQKGAEKHTRHVISLLKK